MPALRLQSTAKPLTDRFRLLDRAASEGKIDRESFSSYPPKTDQSGSVRKVGARRSCKAKKGEELQFSDCIRTFSVFFDAPSRAQLLLVQSLVSELVPVS